MAFPTIPTVANGRVLQAQGASGTTHTFPNLSSLTKNSGDRLMAIILLYDGNSTDAEFSAWGAGFGEIEDESTTTTLAIGVAEKVSDGTETGTFTVTSSGAARSAMFLISIPGAHPSTPSECAGYATGTNAAINPGSVTASWGSADNLFIAVGGTGEDASAGSYTRITAAPTNYGDLATCPDTADVIGSIDGALAFRQLAASNDDPGTFTNDTSNTRWAGLTIVVRPDPNVSVALSTPSTLITVSPGSVDNETAKAITGEVATFATGTVTAQPEIALAGIELTSSHGTIIGVPPGEIAISGEAITSAPGTAIPGISKALRT